MPSLLLIFSRNWALIMYHLRIFSLLMIIALCAFKPVAFGSEPTAMMIVIDDRGLAHGFDHAQHDRLVSMGYKVTLIEPQMLDSTFTRAMAETFDVLIISESVASYDADPLIGARVPMMHNEAFSWDNFSFTNSRMVGFPLPGHEFREASEITDEAWTLWEAAIRWPDSE
jgi:hypothetical protein